MCTTQLMKYTFNYVCDFPSALIHPLSSQSPCFDLASGSFIDHFRRKVLSFTVGGLLYLHCCLHGKWEAWVAEKGAAGVNWKNALWTLSCPSPSNPWRVTEDVTALFVGGRNGWESGRGFLVLAKFGHKKRAWPFLEIQEYSSFMRISISWNNSLPTY